MMAKNTKIITIDGVVTLRGPSRPRKRKRPSKSTPSKPELKRSRTNSKSKVLNSHNNIVSNLLSESKVHQSSRTHPRRSSEQRSRSFERHLGFNARFRRHTGARSCQSDESSRRGNNGCSDRGPSEAPWDCLLVLEP
jgi:hypothetical protein